MQAQSQNRRRSLHTLPVENTHNVSIRRNSRGLPPTGGGRTAGGRAWRGEGLPPPPAGRALTLPDPWFAGPRRGSCLPAVAEIDQVRGGDHTPFPRPPAGGPRLQRDEAGIRNMLVASVVVPLPYTVGRATHAHAASAACRASRASPGACRAPSYATPTPCPCTACLLPSVPMR